MHNDSLATSDCDTWQISLRVTEIVDRNKPYFTVFLTCYSCYTLNTRTRWKLMLIWHFVISTKKRLHACLGATGWYSLLDIIRGVRFFFATRYSLSNQWIILPFMQISIWSMWDSFSIQWLKQCLTKTKQIRIVQQLTVSACIIKMKVTIALGLALQTLSWDKNWDSHSLVNGYPSFYPRIALVAPSPDHY